MARLFENNLRDLQQTLQADLAGVNDFVTMTNAIVTTPIQVPDNLDYVRDNGVDRDPAAGSTTIVDATWDTFTWSPYLSPASFDGWIECFIRNDSANLDLTGESYILGSLKQIIDSQEGDFAAAFTRFNAFDIRLEGLNTNFINYGASRVDDLIKAGTATNGSVRVGMRLPYGDDIFNNGETAIVVNLQWSGGTLYTIKFRPVISGGSGPDTTTIESVVYDDINFMENRVTFRRTSASVATKLTVKGWGAFKNFTDPIDYAILPQPVTTSNQTQSLGDALQAQKIEFEYSDANDLIIKQVRFTRSGTTWTQV